MRGEEWIGFEDVGADGTGDGGFYFGFGARGEVFFEHGLVVGRGVGGMEVCCDEVARMESGL